MVRRRKHGYLEALRENRISIDRDLVSNGKVYFNHLEFDGSGNAMLSLIHNETVVKNQWLSYAEFTDIVAISQSTPGPIGSNCATYVGYTSTLHAGYPEWAAILGLFSPACLSCGCLSSL